jgi:hypothetical protein
MATVPTEVSELEFTGNGATVDFPITFPILDTSDLVVDLTLDGETVPTTQVEGVDYDVSAAPSAAPTVTMNVAPPVDSTLRVRRTVPITQEVNFVTNGPFSPATVTEMADKQTMIAQQLHRRLRAVESAGAAGSVVAGDGLEFDGDVLHVRAGDGIAVSADEVAVDFGDAGDMSRVTKDTAEAGIVNQAARIDHKHDISTGDPVEISDDALSEGTSEQLARADHVHSHGDRGGGTLHATAVSGGDAGFLSGADKAQLDKLVARSRAAASAVGGQVLTAGAGAATVVFGTQIYDTGNEYEPANGKFTAGLSGYYQVSAFVRGVVAVALAVNDTLAINLYRNGALVMEGEVKRSQGTNGDRFEVQLSHTLLMAIGDYLEIKCSCGGQDFTINAKSYLTVARL